MACIIYLSLAMYRHMVNLAADSTQLAHPLSTLLEPKPLLVAKFLWML
jgi:hypothetical protein